ncbi:MAG: putative transport system permease protein, partial [Solirubrobacteraceae bacterium]|nr:putative transport system permease protein [Solirubrobacteraceae bacterium]
MLRLALLSARGRLGTFAGALIALVASSALVMAGAMPLESALRSHPPVERYAAATAVVTGQQTVGADHDVPLAERVRVSSALTARLAAVPGVRAAIGDVSAPARLGGRPTVAHGWRSAALTPYVLTAGRPPAGADVLLAGDDRRGAGVALDRRGAAQRRLERQAAGHHEGGGGDERDQRAAERAEAAACAEDAEAEHRSVPQVRELLR